MRDDTLPVTALRYAARDLPPVETAAFEVRLATDPSAQDALAEAVRLSAAALGRPEVKPMVGLSGLIADRLSPVASAAAGLFRRRAYRGHPMTWAGLGAFAAAAAVTTGIWLADRGPNASKNYAAACPMKCIGPAAPLHTDSDMPEGSRVSATLPPTEPVIPAVLQPPQVADGANPMAAVTPPVASSGGGNLTPTPAGRPNTFLPDREPPGFNPDDMFPFDPPVRY